jgi:hypothetical protein
VAGCAFLGIAVSRPETLRYYLRYAYGWIPAGIALGVVILLWRFRRRPDQRGAAIAFELTCAVLIAVLAAKTYADFLVYAHIPQLAVYALPLVAVFLARVHLVELGRVRHAALLGAGWLALLAVAGLLLTIKDARAQTGVVAGPGGVLHATPAEAHVYGGALAWVERTTPIGRPILAAPQLTWLYTVSGRSDPLPELSLLPGALATPNDERAAIAQLQRARVRTIVISRRVYADEDQTAFGGSFDRVLAAWIHAHFRLAATLEARGVPAVQVWLARG